MCAVGSVGQDLSGRVLPLKYQGRLLCWWFLELGQTPICCENLRLRFSWHTSTCALDSQTSTAFWCFWGERSWEPGPRARLKPCRCVPLHTPHPNMVLMAPDTAGDTNLSRHILEFQHAGWLRVAFKCLCMNFSNLHFLLPWLHSYNVDAQGFSWQQCLPQQCIFPFQLETINTCVEKNLSDAVITLPINKLKKKKSISL